MFVTISTGDSQETRMRTILTTAIMKWQTLDSVWVLALRIIAILLSFPAATAFAQTVTITEGGNISLDYICSGPDCSTITPSVMDSTFTLTSTFDPSTAISICNTGVPGCSGAGDYTFTTGTTTFSSAIFNDAIPISASYSNNGDFSLNYDYGSDLYGLVRMNASTLTSAQFYSFTVPGVAIFSDLYGNPYVAGLPTIPDPVANNNVNFTESYTGSPAGVEGLGGVVVYINDGNPADTNQIGGTVSSLSINSGSSALPPPPPALPPAPLLANNYQTIKAVSGSLVSTFSNLAEFFEIASIVADGPAKLLRNAAIYIAEKVEPDIVLTDQALAFIDALKTKNPISFELDILGLLAQANADQFKAIAADPAGANFTTVSQPPTYSLTLPAVLSQQSNFSIFQKTVSDMENYASYLDAFLAAAENYDGAAEAGDTTSEQLQLTAFLQFLHGAGISASSLGNDLGLLDDAWPALDLSGFTDPATQIADAIGAQCGAPIPSDIESVLVAAGLDSSTIDSLFCQYAADFSDPSVIAPDIETDIAAGIIPAIAPLNTFAADAAAATVDEPSGLVMMLTVISLLFIFRIRVLVRKALFNAAIRLVNCTCNMVGAMLAWVGSISSYRVDHRRRYQVH
jgi:hypothetical protein